MLRCRARDALPLSCRPLSRASGVCGRGRPPSARRLIRGPR
jgi:hypothetical protein